MFLNSGHLYSGGDLDTPRENCPLKVNCCGHYMLVNRKRNEISRPIGRRDFQMLYVHAGQANFVVNDMPHTVPEGHIVLYHPSEAQHYWYELKDRLDLFWIHFTGKDALSLLDEYGLGNGRIFQVRTLDAYADLFDRIIQELQLKHPHFSDLADAQFRQLLCLMARGVQPEAEQSMPRTREVEEAVRLFHSQFFMPFSVEEYAAKCNISACWFTRQFRQQIGVSPQRYLINVRMSKARELLATPGSIDEISRIVGYHDPLYFSRIFKKYTGLSPSAYQRQMVKQTREPHFRDSFPD